jgi:hypothetical protein
MDEFQRACYAELDRMLADMQVREERAIKGFEERPYIYYKRKPRLSWWKRTWHACVMWATYHDSLFEREDYE